MIKKMLMIAILAITMSYSQSANWNGAGDTATITTCSTTVLSYSSTLFQLSEHENIRIIAQVNDTSSVGFASDSIGVIWGYQTFSRCLNSSGTLDTCYSPRVVVDTLLTDSLGIMNLQTLEDGIATTPSHQIDTLSCSGFAVQSRAFTPEWDVYMRIWALGIAGNVTGSPLSLQFTVIRRIYSSTRLK